MHEIELKLAVPEKSLLALTRNTLLRAKQSRRKSQEQVSVYFDTDKLKLWKHGLSLRIRRIGNRHVQTIKRNGSIHAAVLDREEWESTIAGDMPDFSVVHGTALERLLSKKVCRSLKPVFETRVNRTIYPIKVGNGEIALTLDEGRIESAGQSSSVHEIELELKRGEAADLFRLARTLTDKVPAELTIESKAGRGYALLTGKAASPVKAAPVALTPEMTAQVAFQTIARACLHQLVANLPALRAGDPEGLHQARVALRRLRAAISVFSQLLDCEQTQTLKRELKWLVGELGPAREFDVLMTRAATLADSDRADVGIAKLEDAIKSKRDEAFSRAQAGLRSARFRMLALDIASWIEAGDWIRSDDDFLRALRETPIATIARDQLARRWKKVLRRGRELDKLAAPQRHKLRVQGKKLRYASEFFADVFPGKKSARKRRKLLRALKALQDCLGELNDIAVDERLTMRLAEEYKRSVRQHGDVRLFFAAGRIFGQEKAHLASMLKTAEKMYQAFAAVKPHWY